MNNFTKKFLGFFTSLACKVWRVHWSNLRRCKAIRKNIKIPEEDKITSIEKAGQIARQVYKRFDYTADDFDDLWDSIVPPPQNYQNYLDGMIKDDCDGFHSTMYHFMYNSNLENYLLSVIALGSSHCVLLFKFGDMWYINDYTTIHEGYRTPSEAISAYDEKYPKIYTKAKSEVFYNSLVKYDYEKGKFKNQSIKKLK